MLVELAVRDLGVIADLRLTFGPGMTALTGETGAGKTMVVEALALLLGGRADPSRVRPGADEAVIEGLFATEDVEVVLRRVVPAVGRSRAQIDGSLVTTARLTERGAELVEVCGQHGHQRLQQPRAQRDALDRFGHVDLTPLVSARTRVSELEARLASLGGDERSRARDLDLLRYQLAELDRAGLTDPDEDDRLATDEIRLADRLEHAGAALGGADAIGVDDGLADRVATLAAALAGRPAFEDLAERLRGVHLELADVGEELRRRGEIGDDEAARLGSIQARRSQLGELRRKYGPSLGEVIEFHHDLEARVAQLEAHDEIAARLDAELSSARARLADAEITVRDARAAAAPRLAAAVQDRLADLGLGGARVEVAVGEAGSGDDVELRLAASAGMTPQPVARAASGGELSRTMLALSLVLSDGAPTMVFDEVDAGIGGSAATQVGRSLAELGAVRQVLVVTHLPQVAAAADTQMRVDKSTSGLAVTTITQLDADSRVVELSRMLSGSPDSESARQHAAELLESARTARSR